MNASGHFIDDQLLIPYTSSPASLVPSLAIEFDGRPNVHLLRSNLNYILCICVTYVTLVFWSKNVLKDIKPWSSHLTVCAIAWNILLALFSSVCFILFTLETAHVWSNGGWNATVCTLPPHTGQHALWSLLFIVSKVWEFGDTALLVLRRKPVTFLHWYHHCTVLILSCYIGGHNSSLRRIFANVNSGIHGIMYTYYALAVGGFKVPRTYSMMITSLQVIQMVIGVLACIHYINYCGSNACSSSVIVTSTSNSSGASTYDLSPVYFSLLIYFTYLILFLQFFHQAYIKRANAKKVHSSWQASTDILTLTLSPSLPPLFILYFNTLLVYVESIA